MKIYIYTIKIIIALTLALVIGYFVFPHVKNGLIEIKELTAIVFGVFLMGFVFDLIRLATVNAKVNWVNSYKGRNKVASSSVRKTPAVFKDIACKLRISDKEKLTVDEYYSAVKSLDISFSHNRDAGRFFVKLCFMTGLLGAFLCIMIAFNDISQMFVGLNLDTNDSIETLSNLQQKLATPLQSLNKAFALSFLGIYLSCLLSYIDRQSFMVEHKLLSYVDSWLLTCTNQKNK